MVRVAPARRRPPLGGVRRSRPRGARGLAGLPGTLENRGRAAPSCVTGDRAVLGAAAPHKTGSRAEPAAGAPPPSWPRAPTARAGVGPGPPYTGAIWGRRLGAPGGPAWPAPTPAHCEDPPRARRGPPPATTTPG